MNPITRNTLQFLTTDHGPALRRAAGVAGIVVAYVITIAWITGECAYDLGRQLRLAVEARNDQLAAWWVAVLGVAPEAAPEVATEAASAHEEPTCGHAPIALLPAVAASRQPVKAAVAPRPARRRRNRGHQQVAAA